MLYSGADTIFLSLIFSSLHGVIMGLFALFLNLFFCFILIAKNAATSSFFSRNVMSIKENAMSLRNFVLSIKNKRSFFRDFLFAFFYGSSILLLMYIACDGEMRLYVIVISAFFYYIFKKTFGKWLNCVFEYILYSLGGMLLVTFSFALIPTRKTVVFIKRLYHKTVSAICVKISKCQNKTMLCNKKRKKSNRGNTKIK